MMHRYVLIYVVVDLVIRTLLCYVSRDEVQRHLCRLLSKPVGRAVSPLEGAKDINLFMCLL